MKKLYISVFVTFISSIFWLQGCMIPLKGSGQAITIKKSYQDFTKVHVSHSFEAEITKGSEFSVAIEVDDNIEKHLRVEQDGDKLSIGLNPHYVYIDATLKVKITMPAIEGIEFSGATKGKVTGFSACNKLKVEASGASELTIDARSLEAKVIVSGASKLKGDFEANELFLDLSGASTSSAILKGKESKIELSGASHLKGSISTDKLELDLSGASDAIFKGTTKELELDLSGASKADLSSLKAENAKAELSGASKSTIQLDGQLDADLSGASTLYYLGSPIMGEIKTSGASSIKAKK